MDRSQMLKEINAVFVDVLDNDDLVIQESTKAGDVDEWDSLTHIQLIVALEKHFKIRFTAAEIREWKDVGEMMNSIDKKITA